MAYMTKSGKCESRIVYRSVKTTIRKFAIISPIKIPPHLKGAILAAIRRQFNDPPSFGSEYCNVDFRLISNHFCTSRRNLVRFGLLIRSLRRKNLYSQRRIFYWSYFIADWVCNYQLMRIFILCSDGFPYVFAPYFPLLHFPPVRSTPAFSTPAISTPAFSAPPL